MSRINTNVSSLIAQRVLKKNNANLNTSLERLSTGLKINTGKDNPAGLIASENLKAEQTGITTAIDNAQRADNIIGTAEGGLGEVSSLLTELQGLVGQAANTGGLSTEEVNANQLQADSILATINRIAQSTSFQGKQLLNGNYAYSTSSVAGSKIGDVEVNAATLADGSTKAVVINVAQSAQTATVGYTGGAVATGGVTIEIAGNNGTQQLSFGSGTTVAQIITGINAVKTATGVSAAASGSDARFDSQGFGSKQFVSVKLITGAFTTTANQDFGRDATVSVNGATAQADGLNVSYRDAGLDVDFNLKSGINSTNGTTTFYVTGGGAKFALGSKVTETDKASIGISSVSTGSLGDASNGFLSTLGSGQTNSLSSNNLVTSQKIIDKAIKQVSQLRGRLGAFQKFTIGSTINSLGVAYENVSASESAIVDTDFAEETAQLTRSQILSQAASTVLAQANATPQNALALLRG
jgi:flagellin